MTHAKERPVRMSFENLDLVDQGGSFSSPARRSAWSRQYRPNGWDIVVPFLIHICDVPACLDEIRSSEDKIQRIGKKMGWSEWASLLNFALDGRFVQAAKGIEDTILLRIW